MDASACTDHVGAHVPALVGATTRRDEISGPLAAWLREPRIPSLAREGQLPLVLFLCRTNAGSSILAEAILRYLGKGRVRAASAGEAAAGRVNPCALECLAAHGIATSGLRSKAWGEFFGLHRPPVRVLISLFDGYAATANWDHDAVRTVKAHWAMPDPETLEGSEVGKRRAFEEAFATLDARIRQFVALPLERLSDASLSRELARIGSRE